jgi:hypothetical protein
LTGDVAERARVLFFAREVVQLPGLVQRFLDAVKSSDDGF